MDLIRIRQRLLDRAILAPGPLNTPCLIWQGCCGSHGYGMMSIGRKAFCTHRLSHEVFIGPIDNCMFVCHVCDDKKCINWEHLFQGTGKDNTNDMISKGRDKLDINAKLSTDQVEEIRRLYDKGYPQAFIAPMFDVSQATISRVGTRQSYWWV